MKTHEYRLPWKDTAVQSFPVDSQELFNESLSKSQHKNRIQQLRSRVVPLSGAPLEPTQKATLRGSTPFLGRGWILQEEAWVVVKRKIQAFSSFGTWVVILMNSILHANHYDKSSLTHLMASHWTFQCLVCYVACINMQSVYVILLSVCKVFSS